MDASGDLRIDFTSPTFKSGTDKRDLGFLADFARVDLPVGATLPSVGQLFGLLLSAFLLYYLARSVWIIPRAAGLLSGAFLLACASVLALQRLLITIFTPRLLATFVLALVVIMVST